MPTARFAAAARPQHLNDNYKLDDIANGELLEVGLVSRGQ
jgi:hypothetical protein